MNLSMDSGSGVRALSAPLKTPAIVFVQTAKVSGLMGVERFPEGSRIVLLSPEAKGASPKLLSEGFVAAADPQIDFSGKRVLFAAQKAGGERWQIWEVHLDGSEARQITKCDGDCVRPAYLPGEEVAFTSVATEGGRKHASLEVIGLDGSNQHAITFSPGDWWLETVLRDGRIVVSASSPLAENSGNGVNRLLYTLRSDGTGLESLRCEHSKQASRGEASELEDGSIMFIERTAQTQAGTLTVVKRGAVHEEKVAAGPGAYESPNSLGAESIVVARKSANEARYQLFVLPLNGPGEPRLMYADAKLDSLEPVAVQPRPVPKKYWSNLIPTSTSGYFISLDSSNSIDKPTKATAPKRVRVIAKQPGGERALGEAPVEADGSFYVQVPANQAVRFVLLDAQGKVIREEQSWVWTRPGEERGCTGCHGDKALAPENRWPMALKRQGPPTNLSGSAGDAPTVESHGN